MGITEEFKELETGLDKLIAYVNKFRMIIIPVKIIGNLMIIYFLYKQYWLTAVLFWMLFFPDSEEIVRFIKKRLINLQIWINSNK